MSSELIRPNWHVILIHYPLALLGIGLAIEVFSFLWRRSTFRTAGRWMILLGGLLAIPAATSGIYAFRDVVVSGPAEPSMAWSEIVSESHWSSEQWLLMKRHVIYAGIGTGVVGFALLAWLAVSDGTRRRAHWLLVLGALGGFGCLAAAAWYSGEAIYRHGTAVELPATGDDQETSESSGRDINRLVEHIFPPLQVHLALAGLMTASALASLGLSLHWWNREKRFRRDPMREDLGDVPPDIESAEAESLLGGTSRMPFPARYWLLTLLLAGGTFASGLWQSNDWKLQILTPGAWRDERRLAWHAVLGLAAGVVILLLILLTTLLRRWRFPGHLVSLLLLGVLVGQLALGTLMLLDSTTGPVLGLQVPESDHPATLPATRP